jgi:hypothetical protein
MEAAPVFYRINAFAEHRVAAIRAGGSASALTWPYGARYPAASIIARKRI